MRALTSRVTGSLPRVTCALVLASLSAGVGSASAAPPTGAVRAGSHAGQHADAGGDGISLNWAGYVATPGLARVTAVTSTFTVPAVRSPVPPGIGSTWVGIGGSTTGDLIQAGVAEQTVANPITGAQYAAWYELLPDGQTNLTHCTGADHLCGVRPGDRITVVIRQLSAQRWAITVTNSRHWTWSRAVTYTSTGSSAEWITEAVSLLRAPTVVPDLGVVSFGAGNTVTVSGHGTMTIRRSGASPVSMGALGEVNEAVPSPLNKRGDGFNICTYANTCAAPRR